MPFAALLTLVRLRDRRGCTAIDELNTAGLGCGLTYGELIQDAEAKKLLILFREAPSADRRACVYQWARKRHFKLGRHRLHRFSRRK